MKLHHVIVGLLLLFGCFDTLHSVFRGATCILAVKKAGCRIEGLKLQASLHLRNHSLAAKEFVHLALDLVLEVAGFVQWLSEVL